MRESSRHAEPAGRFATRKGDSPVFADAKIGTIPPSRRGFTLIELLVVMTIIAALAALFISGHNPHEGVRPLHNVQE